MTTTRVGSDPLVTAKERLEMERFGVGVQHGAPWRGFTQHLHFMAAFQPVEGFRDR